MTPAALIALLILQQPSATAPADRSPGIIRGRITAADTGRPLRRASVTIVPASDPGGRMTAGTNSLGLFEAKNVPPGSYYVSVARGGFLGLQYGQRRPRERGVTVDVRPGATVDKIDIALPRGGVLAGRITDELGDPYPGVAVSAVGTRYNLGKRFRNPPETRRPTTSGSSASLACRREAITWWPRRPRRGEPTGKRRSVMRPRIFQGARSIWRSS